MGMHLEAVLKMAVRSDSFWSQIRSGFGEQGGTPSPRIPMRQHPPPTPKTKLHCTKKLQANSHERSSYTLLTLKTFHA